MEQYHIYRKRERSGLTRFANSTIHQNVIKDENETKILFVLEKRIGICTSIGKEVDINQAREIAQHARENPDFVSLPDPGEAGEVTYQGPYSDVTAEASPGTRAELVKEVISTCQAEGLNAAGYLTTGYDEIEIENSLGVKRKGQTSFAEFNLTAIGSGTGYVTGISFDLSLLDLKTMTEEAIQTAKMNIDQTTIEPGNYTVLLEPLAVHGIFQWLSYIGFSGLFYDEGRSCFSGKLDREVASP
ncbi:MAG TPA: hypothetical protein EYP24_00615, partial [bacterium (Candidatus Stahlbacteria)]|nr:hypothetical protein [Candidatus Stahlbacteria bacterium]